ncbi:hypothetical protein Tco_0589097 [Tanacetum coccineum]
MSDSEHSTVTYTSVPFPVEDDSDIGSPGINGPPMMPEDPYAYIMAAYEVPPSPDYIPGPEVPPSPDYIPGPEVPPSPDYIPGPEEQPLPAAAASPTADSPGYVPESDPEEEPEEDDEDPEEDPADYPADGDDDDDEDEDEDEDEEEEEHPAPADSVPPVHRMTARISIFPTPPPQGRAIHFTLLYRERVERLLALTTPPPSPLTPLSSPLPQIHHHHPIALLILRFPRVMRAAAPSTYHSLLPSGTPPLLPIPLPAPSTSRRADIPEADTPPRKRLLLTTPRPGCEVGESSAAAAARQPGPTMAHRVDYSLVDTMETRFRDTERRMMTALEMVNMRVSYQVDVRSRESSEFYSRHHDAQKDRAAVRAEIEVLRRERLAYEQESMETRQALARSEAYCRALEARVTVLETEVRRHEWQRQAADDFIVWHIMRTQSLEVRARVAIL